MKKEFKSIGMIIVKALLTASIILLAISLSNGCFAADVPLQWDASVTPTVTGYKVYVGTASGVYGTPITIGNVTAYTVTGLANGTYYFSVTAFDATGVESVYSNEVTETISVKPDPPTNLKKKLTQ
jgi:fibronectin type 3 domain-containing protein